MNVAGLVVIVTGAARGIGAAIAKGFSHAGAFVVGVDRRDAAEYEGGWTGVSIQGDVHDPTIRAMAFDQGHPETHVLVNAAGVSSPHDWRETINTNLTGAVEFCDAFASRVEDRDPRLASIINVTSIGALQGFPGNVPYQASKGGLAAATRAMARDWGHLGIRVNNLVPGYTRTAMTEASWNDPVARAARTDRTLLGRWAEPEDMVGPALFLASDASRYVTGIDLVVDGGWLAKGL